MRWGDAPRWVNVVYVILEWIDYNIMDRISWKLAYRYELLDRFCQCEKCLGRRKS